MNQTSDVPTNKDMLSGWDTPVEEDFSHIDNINSPAASRKKKKNS